MQKKTNPFTENQLSLLRGNFAMIAETHEVDSSYVSRIASGDRIVKSDKSKAVFASLQKLVNLFESISG